MSLQRTESPTLVLFICVCLAAVLWLLNALNQEHTARYSAKVEWTGIEENMVPLQALPSSVQLRVKSTGWSLFYNTFSRKNILVDLSEFAGRKLLFTNDQHLLFEEVLPAKFELLEVSPDSIRIDMDRNLSRKIPVRFNSSIAFDPAFGLSGPVKLTPDSVTVSGAAENIQSLKYWPTEEVTLEALSADKSGAVSLQPPSKKAITLNASAVQYTRARICLYRGQPGGVNSKHRGEKGW